MRIVRPVSTKLELHGQAGGYTKYEVNTEKLTPELCHVLVDLLVRHYVQRFHDGEKESHTQSQWYEEEVIHRSERKLQPRQIDYINHVYSYVSAEDTFYIYAS